MNMETEKPKVKRPLTQEHKDAISKANKGRTLTQDHRDKLSKALTGREMSQAQKDAISKSNKGRKLSQAHKDALLKANKGRKLSQYQKDALQTPEAIAKRSAKQKGKHKQQPWKGVDHHCAISGIFRSPRNVTYPFKNVSQFVRDHENLFLPEDVKLHSKLKCRAIKGLHKLTCGERGTWKGWTLVSDVEKFCNNGNDLLDREEYREEK